ncbi:glucose 1-dehydrogenase [Leptolyngbya sp. 15MV]|nr:glucose 1-dehydrogenase [Leptolyngbya sp. 15MV]
MSRLHDKVAIVTGGAHGMGAATCRLFAAEGAQVVVTDLDSAAGEALAEEIGGVFMALDVAIESDWERVVAATLDRHGRIDVLVNNAGMLIFSTIEDLTGEAIDRLLGVNLTGAIFGMKHCGKAMKRQGTGAIVNISSIDGIRTANGLGLYSASKWALRGVTKTAALEYGHHGVRVNSVHPGGVDTRMGNPRKAVGDDLNSDYGRVPLQRIGQPEEVAAASLFLASDEASYVNGAELLVDGGWNAGIYYPGTPGAPTG